MLEEVEAGQAVNFFVVRPSCTATAEARSLASSRQGSLGRFEGQSKQLAPLPWQRLQIRMFRGLAAYR